METKTGLQILWILLMIQPLTDGCLVDHRINHTREKMHILLKEFNLNNKNVGPWQEPIPELDLKNLTTEEKRHKAYCGLHYMQTAVEMILKHQSELRHSSNHTNYTIEFNRTKMCVAKKIGYCANKTEPAFSSTDIYIRQQWGGTVLKISLEFLDELLKVVHNVHNASAHSINSRSLKQTSIKQVHGITKNGVSHV